MIKVLIIEDEKTAAERLEKLLLESSDDILILQKIQSIKSAVSWFRSNIHPDLILLDIQLADGLSFEIFKEVEVESFIIFTTAYDEFAIRAFEVNSIDYLLKPIDKEKLGKALEKFRKYQSAGKQIDIHTLLKSLENRKDKYKRRFLVSVGEKIKSIDIQNIAYFYSIEKNTFICTDNNHHFALEFSLDKLENLTDPEFFFRINRQYLVSRKSLDKIYILSKSRIKVEFHPSVKENIFVSNARAHDFRKWLDE